MHASHAQHRTLRALLFGLLLVCAQAFAQAHEVVHDPAGEPELCSTCIVGGGLKAAATADIEFTIPAAASLEPAVSVASIHPPTHRESRDARAPPLND